MSRAASRAKTSASRKKFRVGTEALVPFGQPAFQRVRIVEDRGHIGAGGRHLFRVRPVDAEDPTQTFEVPAEDMTAVG